MGRYHCEKDGQSKGGWTFVEDQILLDYVKQNGEGQWGRLSSETGLKRSGKSCRLRWMNYLRPEIKRGNIADDDEDLIIRLQKLLCNRWSLIAGRLPGRTDNQIKNYWNSILRKKTQQNQPDRSRNERKPIMDLSLEAAPSSETGLHVSINGIRPTSCIRNDLDTTNTLAEPLITEVETKNTEAEPDSIDGLLPVTKSDMTWNFIMDLNTGQLSISEFLHTDFSKLSEFNTTSVCRNGSSVSTSPTPMYLQELLSDWADDDS